MLEIAGALGLIGIASFLVWIVWGGWKLDKIAAESSERYQRLHERQCVECGYDLRTGHERCPECGAAIVTELDEDDPNRLDPTALSSEWPSNPIAPRKPDIHETAVVVHRTPGRHEAELLSEQLQARGVSCRTTQKDEFQNLGAVTRRRTQLFVVIMSGDEDAAKEIISRFRVGNRRAAFQSRQTE